MKYKQGSNQHQRKFKGWTLWEKILWTVLILGSIAIYFYTHQKQSISPCPDGGCGVTMVYAADTSEKSVQEKIAIESVREFGPGQTDSYMRIVFRESSYNPYAVNKKSGACGLGQANPCTKMKCALGDVNCQLKWMSKYIRSRYGTPNQAWEHWRNNNWY